MFNISLEHNSLFYAARIDNFIQNTLRERALDGGMSMDENNRNILSPDDFKQAMRRFANTVSVITSKYGDTLGGMTATAVCSATADPPSLLIVVNRKNRSHRLIDKSGAFSVHLLSEQQSDLANRFASGCDDLYATVQFSMSDNNCCPHISGVDAIIDCRVSRRMELGTHTVFLGEAVNAEISKLPPLLYHSGKYVTLPPGLLVMAKDNSATSAAAR